MKIVALGWERWLPAGRVDKVDRAAKMAALPAGTCAERTLRSTGVPPATAERSPVPPVHPAVAKPGGEGAGAADVFPGMLRPPISFAIIVLLRAER
ncbi:MAG TPA: hypothetical protein VH988_29810, partial [Thermoanaerobaculia bacterium]|nr:hypothetical protein [Thermoanaerobaculia bacterium]